MRRTLKYGLVILVTLSLLTYTVLAADIGQLLSEFRQFSGGTLALIFALGFASLAVAAHRLSRIIGHFGGNVGFRVSVRATLAGLLASFYIVQIAGSILGRHHVLRQAGVGPALVSLITYYERATLALVGGGLCVLGGVIVFGREYTAGIFEQIGLGEIAILGGTAFLLSMLISGSRFERAILGTLLSGRTVLRFGEIFGISLAGQALNLLIFYVALRGLGVESDTLTLLGAAAIVSFAASLPISLNGWGVREFAALHVFGILGLPPAEAVAVAVIVGLSSALVVILGGIVLVRPGPVHSNAVTDDDGASSDPEPAGRATLSGLMPDAVNFDRVLAMVVGLSVGILRFFQVYVELSGAPISVNLADPFALIALTALILTHLAGRGLRLWSRPWFPLLLLLFWAWLAVGFAIGWLDFGMTSWALTNRLIGWGVVLGYVAAGAFLTMAAGIQGFRRLVETMAIVAVLIVLVEIGFRYMFSVGLTARVPGNFDGYSANRNAFGFMLLVAASCLIPFSTLYVRAKGTWIWCAILGMLLYGAWLTGGRTVSLVGLGLIATALLLGYGSRRFIIGGISCGILFFMVIRTLTAVAPYIAAWLDGTSTGNRFPGTRIRATSGDPERWMSLWNGVELWFDAPLFGSGLGAFAQMKLGEFGQALLIHSTPVWLLAELGVIGFAIFFGMLVYGAWPALRRFLHLRAPRHQALLLVLLVFAVFGTMHDISYQRIFWLVIGASMAYPGALLVARASAR